MHRSMYTYACIPSHTWLTAGRINLGLWRKAMWKQMRQEKDKQKPFLKVCKEELIWNQILFMYHKARPYFHISANTWVWLLRAKCDQSTHSAFVLNFLSQALAQLNQGNTVSPSSSVWPPNKSAALLDIQELWLFISGALVWNTCSFTQQRENAVDPLS